MKKVVAERLSFDYLGSEGSNQDYPVYRCENDGCFYYLLPNFGRYYFKEIVLRSLYDKYERIYEKGPHRANGNGKGVSQGIDEDV